MFSIAVIGGTGYAGSAIVAEAAARGHQVSALSRSRPASPIPGVTYVEGDAADEATLTEIVVGGTDAVVAALSQRGSMIDTYRDINRAIARVADTAGVPLYVVGGYSTLRPAPGADRFVTDLSHIPAELHQEIRTGAALRLEDLPATPASLNWVFVSPALRFGARFPGETHGTYRLGDEVAVAPEDGGAISASDYALGFVDLIEKGEHHRAQVNLAS